MENSDVEVSGADADIKQGVAYLTGVGQPKDESMAAACFLNAYDRGSVDGIVAAAIIYYCGIGVSRNTQQAAEYANIYLVREPSGRHSISMRELTDMSLGSENGKRLLLGLATDSKNIRPPEAPVARDTEVMQQGMRNKKVVVLAVSGFVVVVVVLAVLFSGNFMSYGGLPKPPAVERLFTAEELKSAKEDAQSLAGHVRNEARQSAR